MDVAGGFNHLKPIVDKLRNAGIRVSIFIEPDPVQMDAAVALGAPVIELHTGAYCDARQVERRQHLDRITSAAAHSTEVGLECHAGHGLTYDTVGAVAALPEVVELNIGHFLIGEAIFSGLDSAIKRMRARMDTARAEAGTPKST